MYSEKLTLQEPWPCPFLSWGFLSHLPPCPLLEGSCGDQSQEATFSNTSCDLF